MTTIKATFKGKREDLEMVLFSGVKNYSRKCLGVNTLFIDWVCENGSIENVMQDINLDMVEMFNCELVKLA